jgi:hypothetical protein
MAEAEARPIAADPKLRAVLQVIQLRLAARLVQAIGHDGSTLPALVWAPPYEPTAMAGAQDAATKSTCSIQFPRNRPMLIRSNGSTSDSGSGPMARRTILKSCGVALDWMVDVPAQAGIRATLHRPSNRRRRAQCLPCLAIHPAGCVLRSSGEPDRKTSRPRETGSARLDAAGHVGDCESVIPINGRWTTGLHSDGEVRF